MIISDVLFHSTPKHIEDYNSIFGIVVLETK